RALLVLADHRGPSYLLAVDKATGKTLWKAERSSRMSWTSPVVARGKDGSVVVVSSSGTVTGHDAATGKRLWELDGIEGNAIPSATVAGDRVVIGADVNVLKPNRQASVQSNCCLRLTS